VDIGVVGREGTVLLEPGGRRNVGGAEWRLFGSTTVDARPELRTWRRKGVGMKLLLLTGRDGVGVAGLELCDGGVEGMST